MKRTSLKIVCALIAVAMLLGTLLTAVQAVDLTQTEGSLTIVKYEVNNGTQTVLEGVTFGLYLVDSDYEDADTIPAGATYIGNLTTDSTGTVTFSNLALGRYLVVEESAPANVVSKIANFLIDIPYTESDGTTLTYDVTVEPKNNTVYGGIVLYKIDQDGSALGGANFLLQKYDDTTSTWVTYTDSQITTGTLTTSDTDGTIAVEGLPAGTYRFVETSAPNGYILDNSQTYEFEVELDSQTAQTTVTPETITVTNELPGITKEITSTTSDDSVNIGDTVSYKITTDVPSTITQLSTYTLTDVLEGALTYDETTANLVVTGVKEDTTTETLTAAAYTAVYSSGTLTITFTTSALGDYESIEVTYDVTLGRDETTTKDGANVNTATLEYSNIVTTDYDGNANTEVTSEVSATEDVYTGGFWIKKINSSGDLLSGAVFKVAATEADAKAGNYLTDENGDVIEITTDSDGVASYLGLAYGTYYLVEVQAPSYLDGTETKYYNLLTSPVEITVEAGTYSSTTETAEITNKKGFSLPATGGIGTVVVTIVGIVLIASGVVVYRKGNKEN